jgi:hypothetical protein
MLLPLLLLLTVAMPEAAVVLVVVVLVVVAAAAAAAAVVVVVETGIAKSSEDRDELLRSERVLLRLPSSIAADTLLAESGGDATESTPLLLPDSAAVTNGLTASEAPSGVETSTEVVLLGPSVGGVLLVGGATVTPAKAP